VAYSTRLLNYGVQNYKPKTIRTNMIGKRDKVLEVSLSQCVLYKLTLTWTLTMTLT